jgi:hypothetical protein
MSPERALVDYILDGNSLDGYLQARTASSSSRHDALFIGSIDNVISQNWSGEDLLERLIALDYVLFDGLTPEHEGQVDQWASICTGRHNSRDAPGDLKL